ncbi:MAG: AmmeMemoRadiSam system radical SAM enzyme [Thermodesulfobacteriota bacterium]
MTPINRRKFLKSGAAGAILFSLAAPAAPFSLFGGNDPASSGRDDISGHVFENDAPATLWKWSREARHYEVFRADQTVCGLCPNSCQLSPGDRGICRSRVNIGGRMYTLGYGNPCSVNVDPIEKKPLLHFKPLSKAFSIAVAGCNLRCLNCQNWQISQVRPEDVRHYDLFPEAVVQSARQADAASIAYTYSEATTFFEYMIDTAALARGSGLSNLWISNGYISPEPLKDLCRVMDAANVNLKAYSDAIYRKLNGGRLQPVLDTFCALHRQKVHFEITNLVVPDYTDDDKMVKQMCGWILEALGPDHPLHFSRFSPQYQLKRLPPTPVSTLTRFREIALAAGIHYVYVGNVPGHDGCHTYCHNCRRMVVERNGYQIGGWHLENGKCRFCGTPIPGIWA